MEDTSTVSGGDGGNGVHKRRNEVNEDERRGNLRTVVRVRRTRFRMPCVPLPACRQGSSGDGDTFPEELPSPFSTSELRIRFTPSLSTATLKLIKRPTGFLESFKYVSI